MATRKPKLTAEAKIIQGLEKFADALEGDQDLNELFTCRQVVLNIKSTPYTPEKVKRARNILGVSQALFAQFLGASKSAVQAWERGERDPSPIACRFMDELTENPDSFRKRFLSLTTRVKAS